MLTGLFIYSVLGLLYGLLVFVAGLLERRNAPSDYEREPLAGVFFTAGVSILLWPILGGIILWQWLTEEF